MISPTNPYNVIETLVTFYKNHEIVCIISIRFRNIFYRLFNNLPTEQSINGFIINVVGWPLYNICFFQMSFGSVIIYILLCAPFVSFFCFGNFLWVAMVLCVVVLFFDYIMIICLASAGSFGFDIDLAS